jgi:predicted ATPase/DNA-binding SARP family transcriptional activator
MDGLLEIFTLGGLAIRRGAVPVTGFELHKEEALLVYLACTRRAQPREALAELLFAERFQAQALSNLRVVLAGLRKRLNPYLLTNRQTLAFEWSQPAWLDVAVLDQCLGTAGHSLADAPSPAVAAQLEKGLALYQGDFLAGFYVRDCPGFEDWVRQERERLRQQVIEALHTLVNAYLADRAYAAGIKQATRLLALDPLREEAHQQLMTLLARTGQRSEALAQYETCRGLLETELGLPPQAETTALYEAIRAGTLRAEPARVEVIGRTAARPAHNLPAQPTAFIGRQTELDQIAGRLAVPDCRLLTVLGPGGIGKTRLALQAAAEQTANFAQGVYFVPMAPVGSSDQIASAIADALQFSFYGSKAPAVQLTNTLRDKHLLLVLDNFEHLLAGTPLLSDLLASTLHVKLLVTSRERLNLQEEWALALEGLPYPVDWDLPTPANHPLKTSPPGFASERHGSATGIPVEKSERRTGREVDIERYSAVQLFVQRAQQVQAHFSLAENSAAVVRICQTVEGMPLGIELAASWLRVMPCSQIAHQLQGSLDFLATPLRNVPERHRNLRGVFEHSWRLLSEDERSGLTNLSVFRGGFDLEAAEQVAGASLTALASLVDKSLVRLSPSGRYDLHELLRQFASDKLLEAGEAETNARRHFAYFFRLAEQAEAHLYGPEQEDWFDRLETDHDNLRAALAWSLRAENAEAGLRLAGSLEWFWNLCSHYHEAYEWLDKLLAEAGDAPASVRAKALQSAGYFAKYIEPERAQVLSEESLALAREVGDKRIIAWALGNLGSSVGWLDRRGVELYEEALTLFREIGDGWGTSHMLRRLGWLLMDQGDYERATALLEEALTLARAAKEKNATAWALLLLGNVVWFQRRDPSRAMPLYQESLALSRQIREKFHLGQVLFALGEVARSQGDYGRAQSYYGETLALVREAGENWPHIAPGLIGFGELCLAQGMPERAARLLGAADLNRLHGFLSFRFYSKRADVEHDVAAARAQLGEEAFAAAWAEGQAMTLDLAIAYALSGASEK